MHFNVRRKFAFICILFMVVPFTGTLAAAMDLPDLDQLLSPITYPLLESHAAPTSLQGRLQSLTEFLETSCTRQPMATIDKTKVWACYWPRLLKEYDKVATRLGRGSPDPDHLFLTLSARLHPDDLFATFDAGSTGISFDALYARYLLATRLLRETWPVVEAVLVREQAFQQPQDRFIEPWLTSETPWSFALAAMKSLRCGPDHTACELKAKLGRFLHGALNLIDEDSVLSKVSKLDPNGNLYADLRPDEILNDSSSASQQQNSTDEGDPNDARMSAMLQATLENSGQGYAFVRRDLSDMDNGIRQIDAYLNHVDADSAIPLATVLAPQAHLCRNLPVLADLAKRLELPWADALTRFPATCDDDQDRASLASMLESSASLDRFQLFELRAAIAFMYPRNKLVDIRRLRQGQLIRTLRDDLQTIQTLRALDLPSLLPEEDAAKIHWTQPLLMHFFTTLDDLEKL